MKQDTQIIIITCQECGQDFDWTPMKRWNSTIKPKAPQLCRMCTNKKLLAKSDLMAYRSKSQPKPGKYTIRDKKGRKTQKKATKTIAMNLADQWFSRYIRVKHHFTVYNDKTYCLCYTCDTQQLKPAKDMECGHWQRRGYKAVRYHPDNARPQCNQCNWRQSGKPEIFEERLKREIGKAGVEKLKRMALANFQDSEQFYREQATKYRLLTNKIIKDYGIKKWW